MGLLKKYFRYYDKYHTTPSMEILLKVELQKCGK